MVEYEQATDINERPEIRDLSEGFLHIKYVNNQGYFGGIYEPLHLASDYNTPKSRRLFTERIEGTDIKTLGGVLRQTLDSLLSE